MHISELYDAASKRPGNKDPFLAWWNGISAEQTRLESELQDAVTKSLDLETGLDGTMEKEEEFNGQFDVVVKKVGLWVEEREKVLNMERVKKIIADEEALMNSKGGV